MANDLDLGVLLRLQDRASAPLKKSLGVVDKQTKKSTKSIATLGKQLRSHWLAIAGAIAGVVAAVRGISVSLKAFADFEQGLTNIKILLGENKDRIVLFEKEVEKLAKTYGVATTQLLKSAFDIQSAVGNVAKSIDILNASTELAIAGGAEMVSTTKGLVTLMESYGHQLRDASDAADLLFIAQVRARATIAELAETAGSFLPIAAKLNIKVEEIFAAFSQMTIALGNVNESSTAMTGILNGLFKPTDELQKKVKEWFGVSVQQAVAQGKFLDILGRLGELEKEELGRMIPRIRGLKGLVAVSAEIEKVRGFAIENMERQGQVQAGLNDQMDTTARRMAILREQIEGLKRAFGELIVKTKVLETLTHFFKILSGESTDYYALMQEHVMAEIARVDALMAKNQDFVNAKKRGDKEISDETKKRAVEFSILSEKQINAYHEQAEAASFYFTFLSQALMGAAQENKSLARIAQTVALAEAIMNTSVAVTRAFKDFAWPFSLVVGGIMAAAGAIQVATIAAQRFHAGGIVKAHDGLAVDEVPIIAQRGEGVLSRRGMAAIGGGGALNDINRGGGVAGLTVNIENASFESGQGIEDVIFEISTAIEEQRRARI